MKMASITSRVETITPERAENLLAKAKGFMDQHGLRQRTMKPSKVAEYARAMQTSEWQLNGEAVILDKHGIVKDGQHRLKACVQAKVQFETVVVQGVEPEVFRTIDTGSGRSASDVLTISGYKNTSTLASALQYLAQYLHNGNRITEWESRNRARPTKAQLLDLLERHPRVSDFCAKVHAARIVCPMGLAAMLWYVMDQKDPLLAETFWDSLFKGEGLQRGDPMLALRQRLIRDRTQRPTPLVSSTAELIVRTWNSVRKNESRVIVRNTGAELKLKVE
jgi:hypothetical protein